MGIGEHDDDDWALQLSNHAPGVLDRVGLGPLHGDVVETWERAWAERRWRNDRGGVDVVKLAVGHGEMDAVVGPGLDVFVAVEDPSLGREEAGELEGGRGILEALLASQALTPNKLLEPGLDG